VRVLGVDPGTRVTGYGVVETGNGNGGGFPGWGDLSNAGCSGLLLPIRCPTASQSFTKQVFTAYPAPPAVRARPGGRLLSLRTCAPRSCSVTPGASSCWPLSKRDSKIAQYAPAMIKKNGCRRRRRAKVAGGGMVAHLLRLKHAPKPSDAADGVRWRLTYFLRS